jgi:DNA-directed RNA polymerase II subunit RPB9
MCLQCGEDWAPGFMLEAEDEPSHEQPQYYMDHDFESYDDDFFDDEDMEDVMS